MEKYYFKLDHYTCLEQCKVNDLANIGSISCKDCYNNNGFDWEENWIKCSRLSEAIGKPKFKSNDWVVYDDAKILGRVKKVIGESIYVFEEYIMSTGLSGTASSWSADISIRLATHEEIYETLVKNAKLNGFDVGVEFETDNGNRGKIKGFKLIIDTCASILCGNKFKKDGIHLGVTYGKYLEYTTSIENLTIKPKPQPLKISGYEVKIDKEKKVIDIGCVRLSFKDAKILHNAAKICHDIGLIIGLEGEIIRDRIRTTLDQQKQIIKEIKK